MSHVEEIDAEGEGKLAMGLWGLKILVDTAPPLFRTVLDVITVLGNLLA